MYQLFFINKNDKTQLYDTVSFNFLDESIIEISLVVPLDYIIISQYSNIMKIEENDR